MSNIYQKPEKIASAIYLLTSFWNDLEPSKWKLRTLASDLAAISVSLMSQMFKEREAARLEIRSIILEANALLSVAKNAGLVSEQNFEVMSRELRSFIENLGFPVGIQEVGGAPVLSENFFGSPEKELKSPEPTKEIVEKDKTQEENLSYNNSPRRELLPRDTEEPREAKDKPLREYGAVSVKKNSRQSVIIGLLKRKKEIMIKDVSALISGCSEKTIQRELLAMVQAGILKKTGEKRWSRYSLA